MAWVFAEIADGANMFNSTFLVNIVIHLSIDPRLIGNLENIQNRTGHGMAWHGMASTQDVVHLYHRHRWRPEEGLDEA